jgi:hypothetical protein
MDNRVINHCKGGETYNPKTNGRKSWLRQEWFKCGMGWFTWNENFSFSAFGASDGLLVRLASCFSDSLRR